MSKPAGFSRSMRLLRHADFDAVYRQGKRHFAACMTVFYLRRAPGTGMRVGLTVARGLGGAVQRNRMKRRLREAVRLNRRIEAPVDIVINPKPALLKADFPQVQSQIARAFDLIEKEIRGPKIRP
ncbi:MAG TPA: ribonuclease P protein component [Terriglobales bacterium]|nr:ribonuclease P protein component [Terriglobales bacterium]